VQECQWLLKLHTYGLLNNSFQPASQIRVLRTYWRQRAEHVQAAASCIQRMQKALTQMNVQLANVISDLGGLTGQLIVRAIVRGERDPQKLAALRDRRMQASPEEVAKSLEGNWRPELLFLVKQEVDAGVDLTRIDGIDVMVAQTILAEVGLDMVRWETEGNFVSWLGLCPDNRITGNKIVGRGTRHVVNRAATSLRMAANALLRSCGGCGRSPRRYLPARAGSLVPRE
jgi:hypothetical protein